MSTNEEILRVENLYVKYRSIAGIVHAVSDVSFELRKGEVLGIAGESGCGKTTLGYALMKILPPNGYIEKGKIVLDGIDITSLSERKMKDIRWKKISMIFQGAMNALNPVLKVGDQIAEVLMYHQGLTKEQAIDVVKELFEKVGLDPERVNDYPHQFSGGMKQRVVIAMALALNPPIVIADEPTTALDVTIQAQILDLLKNLQREMNMSFIMITHDLAIHAQIADRMMIMYAGYVVEQGDVRPVFKRPIHPYTKGLIGSVPSVMKVKEMKEKKKRLFSIPGAPPTLLEPPKGCPFADRCPYAKEICKKELPPLREVDGRLVRCHFAEELIDVPAEELYSSEI